MPDPPRILLHTLAPASRDGWQLGDYERAAAASSAHPYDHGPELVYPIPATLVPPGYYPAEAVVELDTGAYRNEPAEKGRLVLRQITGTGSVYPVDQKEGFALSSGWDMNVRFGPEAQQRDIVGWRLHIFGPWGFGALDGGTRLVQAYVDCLPSAAEPPAGELPP